MIVYIIQMKMEDAISDDASSMECTVQDDNYVIINLFSFPCPLKNIGIQFLIQNQNTY